MKSKHGIRLLKADVTKNIQYSLHPAGWVRSIVVPFSLYNTGQVESLSAPECDDAQRSKGKIHCAGVAVMAERNSMVGCKCGLG